MRIKFKYYPVTYGHIVAAWQIIILISRYEDDAISARDAIRIVSRSGKLGGTIPAKQGLRICLDYGFAKVENKSLYLSEISIKEIVSTCSENDPNIYTLRALLFQMISYHDFHWLIGYDSDPDIFREYLLAIDPEWEYLLDNAKLFDFTDNDTINWWSSVLMKYEDYKEKKKKAIGDVGEKLTYIHELDRISHDGFTPSKSFVKWASQISDRFGYDIASIRGQFFKHNKIEKDKIQIEVKSSDSANIEAFRFFISKPEWNTALRNIDSYFFYCWSGVNIEKENAQDGPFVIPALDLQELVPKDVSKIIDWSECRCVLDVSKYRLTL